MTILSKFFYQKRLDEFMKKLLGIVVLSLLLSGNANSYAAFGIFQCGELISRKNNEVVKKQVINYAQGYITGRNSETNGQVGKGITGDAFFWSIVKYCEDNPLKDGVDALQNLYKKLNR